MNILIKDTPFELAELGTQLLRRNYYVTEEFDRPELAQGSDDESMGNTFVRHLVLDLSKPSGDHKKVSIAKQLNSSQNETYSFR